MGAVCGREDHFDQLGKGQSLSSSGNTTKLSQAGHRLGGNTPAPAVPYDPPTRNQPPAANNPDEQARREQMLKAAESRTEQVSHSLIILHDLIANSCLY